MCAFLSWMFIPNPIWMTAHAILHTLFFLSLSLRWPVFIPTFLATLHLFSSGVSIQPRIIGFIVLFLTRSLGSKPEHLRSASVAHLSEFEIGHSKLSHDLPLEQTPGRHAFTMLSLISLACPRARACVCVYVFITICVISWLDPLYFPSL